MTLRIQARWRRADLAMMLPMATLDVEEERVVVRFTGRQAAMALARQVSVPIADVTADPGSTVRWGGGRSPPAAGAWTAPAPAVRPGRAGGCRPTGWGRFREAPGA